MLLKENCVYGEASSVLLKDHQWVNAILVRKLLWFDPHKEKLPAFSPITHHWATWTPALS